MEEMPKSCVIVGASSGIGAALVEEMLGRGFRVAALARRAEQLEAVRAAASAPERVSVHAHDVCDRAAIPGLVQQLESELGGIGVFIYAAGIMPEITPQTYDADSDASVIEINLTGAIAWCDAVVPAMRERGSGHVIGIGSIAGDRGRRGYPAYNTSKAGLHTFLEVLRNREHRNGLRVTTIKPGFVETAMLEGREGTFWEISPQTAARTIASAGLAGKTTRYVPWRWGLVGLVIRSIPSFLFRRLNF